jgi:hypothetical protein
MSLATTGAGRSKGQNAAIPVNPGDMESWLTDRKPLDVAAPASGNTGQMENWITDRLSLNVWAGRTA